MRKSAKLNKNKAEEATAKIRVFTNKKTQTQSMAIRHQEIL